VEKFMKKLVISVGKRLFGVYILKSERGKKMVNWVKS